MYGFWLLLFLPEFVVSLLFLLAGPFVLIITLFRALAGYVHFGVLFVDNVLPVAATEGWNMWFELCGGGYQSHYILMTL